MLEPLAQWCGLSSTLFGNTHHTTAPSPSLMTHATKQTHMSKNNTVAPAPLAPVVASIPASSSAMEIMAAASSKAVEEVRSTELASVSTRQAMATKIVEGITDDDDDDDDRERDGSRRKDARGTVIGV
eukprot:gene4600-3293_t